MAITFRGTNALSFSANSVTPAMPTHEAGDMLLAMWSGKPFDGGVSVSGWTDLGSGASGSTAAGVDTGSMKGQVWWKEAASASETAPTFTEGSPTWNVGGGGVISFAKEAGDTWETPVVVYGGDEDLDQHVSVTMPSDPGVTSGDVVMCFFGSCSDATGPIGPNSVTQTGVTFGSVTTAQNQETTTGGDMSMVTFFCFATSGTSSAAPVLAGTGTNDPGSPRMIAALIRLRVSAAAPATSLLIKRESPARKALYVPFDTWS